MFKLIRIGVSDRIGTITLNRPAASNAFARESYGEVRQAVEELGRDSKVGVIVITGEGKHFSAGGDIPRFKTLIETEEFLSADGILYASEMTKAIRHCPKPVIAMVNGVATGAGLSLCLACDYRVVAPDSKLIMGFVKMGLPGDTGSIYFLTRLLGIEKASLMMMTGEPIRGDDAVRLGLATKLAESEKLAQVTYEFAAKLASLSTTAIGRQKEILSRYFFGDLEEYYKDEARTMAAASREPDFKEAVFAFIEKREPKYNKEIES